jgi:hypothetical protein
VLKAFELKLKRSHGRPQLVTCNREKVVTDSNGPLGFRIQSRTIQRECHATGDLVDGRVVTLIL